ncbi:hypothetical protein SAMN02745945_02102 [Peptoclostridium litorale DSM 5388]|uniref:YkgJ family cysteine cluster protein n=1 Tax=Peptoclostridium litorale DSM 5388 TaxID=1121324 RepID=A0A069RF83_PEPLI|nr:YkgJ family cysteine cluster protein [Peptoclostridium litorale]KDR95453.1 hypothetical protein CLIT_10c01800 [Peptoclostridium litorale DSM 5388]SIO18405.1 hypothetical protein SAMN02745945_02102 [Peptoclostridium litorale DSM 5388]
MKTLKTLEGISDGKIYDIKDMVKADAGGCEGCSACCHGVGDLVVLNPFDVYEIASYLNVSFDELLEDKIELRLNDKIILPHLKMHGESERCGFLNEEDRCYVHAHRPNICRLFPLGRVYEEDDFKYFLQVGACLKNKLKKVKVKKWIGIKNHQENKAFILAWHNFIKALSFRIKFIREEQELSEINEYLLNMFYRMTLKEGEDFYTAFFARLPEAKAKLGII